MIETGEGTPGVAQSRLGEEFSVDLIREIDASGGFPQGAFLFRLGEDYPYEKWRGDRRWFDKRDFGFVPTRESVGPTDD